MTDQDKQQLESIHNKLDNNLLTIEDAKFLLSLIHKQGVEIQELKDQLEPIDKLRVVAMGARDLMKRLGTGARDVSHELAQIHQSVRILDGKDYLEKNSGIIY